MSATELENLFGLMFRAHPWHGLSPGEADGLVNAYVEIAPTDTVKYELDKPSGLLRIDRPQRFSSLPPSLYGFIPQTYCGEEVARLCSERTGQADMHGDGDPLDICILTEKTFTSGDFLARARPIGGLRMVDANEADDKIIAVLDGDFVYGGITDLAQCPKPLVDRLEHYFASYKQLPTESPRRTRIASIYDRAEAIDVIARSIRDYRAKFGAPEDRIAALRKLLKPD